MEHTHPVRLERGRIAVAVNGTPAALRATELAAREAGRRERQLQVVHVVPRYLSAAAMPPVPELDFEETGAEILTHAVGAAREVVEDLDVVTTRTAGSPVREVLAAVQGASLLVVGAHQPPLGTAWTGSVVTGLAARAPCPVLVTPAATSATAPSQRRIVAGLKATTATQVGLLERALEVASDLGAVLHLVHGWSLPAVYDRFAVDRSAWQGWRDEQTGVIAELVEDLRAAHPEVEVTIEVQHTPASQALLEASLCADRLLVSRPAHGGYLHHLGSTTRSVLGGAACPVEVVPARVEDTPPRRPAAHQPATDERTRA